MCPGGGLGGDRLGIADPYRPAAYLLEDRAHNGVRERVEHAAGHDRLAFNLQSLNAAGATEPAANLSSDCLQIGKPTLESKVGLVESHVKGIIHAGAWTSTRLSATSPACRPAPAPRSLQWLARYLEQAAALEWTCPTRPLDGIFKLELSRFIELFQTVEIVSK